LVTIQGLLGTITAQVHSLGQPLPQVRQANLDDTQGLEGSEAQALDLQQV